MKLDLRFDEIFEMPVDAVWRAMTNPQVLARWLMENDFAPRFRYSRRGAVVSIQELIEQKFAGGVVRLPILVGDEHEDLRVHYLIPPLAFSRSRSLPALRR